MKANQTLASFVGCLLALNSLVALNLAVPGARHMTTQQGLPGSVVYRVAQGRQGFIWIGTESGLARYDGSTFRHFTVQDGLPATDVLDVYVDRRNILWIMTLGQLCYMTQARDIIRQVPAPDGADALSVMEDKAGDIWVTTKTQLLLLPQGNAQQLKAYPLPEELQNPLSVCQDEHDSLVLVAWPDVVARFHPSNPSAISTRHLPAIRFMHPYSCVLDHRFGIVVNSLDGPRRIDKPEEVMIPELASQPVHMIKVTGKGIWWFSIPSGGIQGFRYTGGRFEKVAHLLPKETVTSLYEDQQGNLWLSTATNGLFFFPYTASFLRYTSIMGVGEEDPAIYSMKPGSDSTLWLGGMNRTVGRSPDGRFFPVEAVQNDRGFNRTLEILEPAPGQIWLLTDMGLGLYRNGRPEPLSSRFSAKCGIPDGQGGAWIGTGTGLVHIPASQVYLPRKDRERLAGTLYLPHKRIYALAADSTRQVLWLGTSRGLERIGFQDLYAQDKPTQVVYRGGSVSDLWLDHESNLWMATKGDGLYCVREGQSLQRIGTETGLASLTCNKLYLKGPHMFIGTNKGLSVFYLSTPKGPQHLRNISTFDGLLANDVFDVFATDKLVILATSQGLVSFPTDLVYEQSPPPKLYIQDVLVGGQSVMLLHQEDPIELSANDQNLTVEFVAIDFLGEDNIEYRFQLKGFDDDWIYTRVPQARYTHLPSGEYEFLVQSKKSNMTWTGPPKRIDFVVRPPFWRSWWFISLMVVALLGMLFSAQYLYFRNRERKWLRQVVDQQTRQLRAQNKELTRSNEELRQFAYVVSHDLKSPLRTIVSFIQLIQRKSKAEKDPTIEEYMDHVVQGAKQMNALISDLLTYAQIGGNQSIKQPVLMKEVFDEILQSLSGPILTSQARIEIGPLPQVKAVRYQIVLLFQNLIENALKFSGERSPHIQVNSTSAESFWVISVKDHGIGIEPQYREGIFQIFRRLHPKQIEGTGIGLSICKKIVDLHEGRIEVQSQLGEGTTFQVWLPKGE